jgi:2-oxoglutarate-Fe(II)-dependent oxygenase superfamily protein
MSSITTKLAELLGTVCRPGDFFAAGTIEIPAPRLEVEGVGLVALPLLPIQAGQLVAVAERAPYGRGAETLVDTEVRRTWQIGASRVRIAGKHWARALDAILARVAEGLGVNEPIAAELYKLLVYDQGSFFASHRDTEKVPGMFATLVVALPSVSTGGELVVRHKSREVRLDLRCDEPSEAAFAAFYADCVHEVRPVASGCRLTLVYNLLRKGQGAAPTPPSYEGELARVTALLRAWAAGKQSPDDDAPEKLIYPLEHAYTPAELGFDTLKGADAAVAGVLVAAAPQGGCDLHLALVSIAESGAAEYTADFGSRRGRWSDEDEFEAGEVYERHVSLSEWRRPDGGPSTLGELPIEEEELSPPDALEDMNPDEEHFHEATGNEGASFERTYRRAALVLWPCERIFAVLNQAGLPVTLPYLDELTERWVAGGEDRQSPLWRQADELAGQMLSTWPTQGWYPREDKGPSEAARMLSLLTRLENTDRINALMGAVIAGGGYAKSDNAAILGALGLFPPDQAAALMQRMIAGTGATSLGASGDLLARAVAALPHGLLASFVEPAASLVDVLPGDPSRAAPRDPWRRDSGVQPGFVVDLFAAVARIDEALADRAANHILAWPATYGLDAVLIPAVRQLVGSVTINSVASVQRLRIACVEHLRVRVAESLEAPKDWRRASKLACQCPHCGELSRFLADPGSKTWTLKAAEAARGHVEETIRKARCDLNVTTDRRGRPYSLVCTKNQASYERRMKQRHGDLADLEQLKG